MEQSGFADVSKNDWFYDAVQDAVDMGLMAGVSANRFDPKGTVTALWLPRFCTPAKVSPPSPVQLPSLTYLPTLGSTTLCSGPRLRA